MANMEELAVLAEVAQATIQDIKLDLNVAQRFFTDDEFTDQAAHIFVTAGWNWGVEWLARGHQAARENVFEALAYLDAGDLPSAVKAFNVPDGEQGDVVDIVQNSDGTMTATRRNLPAVTFRLENLVELLISPAAFFLHWQSEQQRLEDAARRFQ